MGIQAIATFKQSTGRNAIEITVDGISYAASYGDISGFTEKRIENAIKAWANANGVTLPVFGVHKNRDGCLFIWTGIAPSVWPEDKLPEGG